MTAASGFEHAIQRLRFEHERELASLHAEIDGLKQGASNEEIPIIPRNSSNHNLFACPEKAATFQTGTDSRVAFTSEGGIGVSSHGPTSEKVSNEADQSCASMASADQARPSMASLTSEVQDVSLKMMEDAEIVAQNLQGQPHRRWGSVESSLDGNIVCLPIWLDGTSKTNLERRLQTLLISKRDSEEITAGGGFGMVKKLLMRNSAVMPEGSTRSAFKIIAMVLSALLVRPGSHRKFTWDAATMSALCFDLFWIPLQVFSPEETMVVSVFSWSTLIIWTLDILMSFITGYSTPDGVEVLIFRRIVIHYFKTWFLVDTTIVGLDWFLMLARIQAEGEHQKGGSSAARVVKFMRLARMLRTLRFLRLLKLREFLYAAQQKLDTEWAAIMYGMVFNVLLILVLNHVFACLWFLMGKADLGGWVASTDTINKGMKWQYFTSLHWTLTQFTPASSEIQPWTGDERIFAVFMLIFGLLVFSSFLSSVTAGVTRLRNMQEAKAQQRYALRRYLLENNISSSLGVRINRYIDIVQQVRHQRIHASEVKLLQLLSHPLRVELQTELHAPTLTCHEVFWLYDQRSHAAMSHICYEAVAIGHLSKHDVLFSNFSEAHFTYIITGGAMVYIRIEDIETEAPQRCYVQKGLLISEPTLWVHWIHRGTMVALTETNAMNVNGEIFGQVTRQQQDVYVEMKTYARRYVEEMRCTAAAHGLCFDLDFESMASKPAVAGMYNEVIKAEKIEAELFNDMPEREQ